MRKYTLAIASGKGGTGKTTLSVALSRALAKKNKTLLLDCDVEEPNCMLFFDDLDLQEQDGTIITYQFDNPRCSGCGKCAEACRFNALAILHHKPLFFPELCHGCGGCLLACPSMAITETERVNGKIYHSVDTNPAFSFGRLNVGEAMSSPLIRKVREHQPEAEITIIDSPPGASCSMLSAVRGADLTILVTEPTPFGLNDLRIAAHALEETGQDFAVVTNRDGIGDNRVLDFCSSNRYLHMGSIPYQREVAEFYSRGQNPYDEVEEFTKQVNAIADHIQMRITS